MSSWADQSEDPDGSSHHDRNEAPSSDPPRRKKLQLKPRSANAHASSASHSSSKSNPFGAAKPREEVLASKGIDAKAVDERIQKKASTVHFSKEQNMKIEEIQGELKQAEAALRDANENELPEEEFRVKAEAKRKELHDLMEQFTKENEAKQEKEKQEHVHYERPSERRKRLDEEHHHHQNEGESGGDAFASFGARNRRQNHE